MISQAVVYDWIPPYCKNCHLVGHNSDNRTAPSKPQIKTPAKMGEKIVIQETNKEDPECIIVADPSVAVDPSSIVGGPVTEIDPGCIITPIKTPVGTPEIQNKNGKKKLLGRL